MKSVAIEGALGVSVIKKKLDTVQEGAMAVTVHVFTVRTCFLQSIGASLCVKKGRFWVTAAALTLYYIALIVWAVNVAILQGWVHSNLISR